MTEEIITVTAAGKSFTGWKNFELTSAINEAVRAFRLKVSEIPGSGSGSGHNDSQNFPTWNFPPNTPIQVSFNGTLFLDGYVDDYEVDIDKDTHEVSLSGRGKGADFVDSSITHPTHQFENMLVEAIAQQLSPSVVVKADVDTGPPVVQFRARQGSTPHDEALRLCQQRKLVMCGKADGSVNITRAGINRHTGLLQYGLNVMKASAKLSARLRFSDYIALGQESEQLYSAPKAQVKDSKVPRARAKVVIDQAQTNTGLLRTRADWERSRAAGLSAKATLVVPSFRDDGGVMWEPSWLVFVDHAPLKLHQDMVIEKVELFKSSDEGTGARITVVDPRTYAGEAADAQEQEDENLYGQDDGA